MNKLQGELTDAISRMEDHKDGQLKEDIKSNKFIIGPIIVFIKRCIKKFFMRWYVKPFCDEQVNFNNSTLETVELINHAQNSIIADQGEMIIKIQELEDKITSEVLRRLDSDENSIRQITDKIVPEILTRLDSDENSIRQLAHQSTKLEDNFAKIGDLGIDLFDAKPFNMLNKVTNSQTGEDSILAYIVAVLGIPFNQCTYLDLGANHPKEMNNTYFFYSQGARGVLVEANPDLIPELIFCRNEDIILNNCVDIKSGKKIPFHILNVDGLSTPDLQAANETLDKNQSLEVTKVVEVETITVNDVIDKYMGKAPVICSIDVEGKDIEILKSIDLSRHRPLIIVIEMIEYSTKLTINKKNQEIMEYMSENEYEEFAFTGINSIFIDKKMNL